MSDVNIISMTCPNCSAPLEVPKMKAKVFCQFCGAEVVIQGVDKNAEIKKKGDINSGFPFKLNAPFLHAVLTDIIADDIYAPVDIFQSLNVLSVEKAVVPGYFLYCNGTLNYTYELGMQKTRDRIEKRGDSLVTVTETYTEWIPQSALVTDSKGFFAPANNEFAEVINRLFSEANPNMLVDVEMLDFPADCIDYNNDIPVTVAFGTFVKPKMDKLLEQKGINQLMGRQVRNFMPGGSSVMKDQEVRVALAFYIIKFEYQDKLYKIFINNDASAVHVPDVPIDASRLEAVRVKESERDSIKAGTGLLTTGFVFGIIATVIGFFGGIGNASSGSAWAVLLFFIMAAGIAGIVVTSIFKSKKTKIYNEKRAAVQVQIDAINDQIPRAAAQFRAELTPFRGYFANLAGNPEAFKQL